MTQMGSLYQHPTATEVKFRIRAYLLGQNCELVGSNYNTEKENHDISLSEKSFSDHDEGLSENNKTETDTIESELVLPVMVFASDLSFDNEGSEGSSVPISAKEGNLEDCIEAEGLRNVEGFIAHKFHKYE